MTKTLDIYVSEIRQTTGCTRHDAEQRAVAGIVAVAFGNETIGHTPAGAPYIVGHEDDVSISVSHCKTHAAVAVTRDISLKIGVDIENLRQRLEYVALRFINERDVLPAEETSESRLKSLLSAWTAKEATFKAARVDGLMLMDIIVDLNEQTAEIAKNGVCKQLFLQSWYIDDVVMLTLAVSEQDVTTNIFFL